MDSDCEDERLTEVLDGTGNPEGDKGTDISVDHQKIDTPSDIDTTPLDNPHLTIPPPP